MTLRNCIRSPLFWILAAAVLMRLAGLFWGLPASDGWDDDGFAPRNFLTALALTYKPGAFFTYPPFHAFILAILTLPGSALALLHAQSFAQADIVHEFTKVPYMTFFTIVARLVSVVMSLGIIWCAAQMAQQIAGRRAGLFAACACALNMSLVYYGQVTNLDVPYLFWTMLSLLACMRAIAGHEPKRFWHAALLAAAAIATKDQASAIFLLSLPVVFLLWFYLDEWPRRHASTLVPALLLAAAVSIFLLLLVDGAITNPDGFLKRLAFLTGSASGDFAAYPGNWRGQVALLRDMATWFVQGPAVVASLLTLLGLGIHVSRFRRDDRGLWVAGLLPLLGIVSFVVCFNFTALRTDARFLLPQAILATIYIGIAADRLVFDRRLWLAAAVRAGLLVATIFALHYCFAVNAAFLSDARYDAESWMHAHVQPGDTIEIYGQNAYLPRFPRDALVTRVGQKPLKQRNPLPGVTEVEAPFEDVAFRNPRFLVISDWWVRHYLSPQSELGGNRIPSKVQQAQFNDPSARSYFARIQAGDLNYRLAHVSAPAIGFWPQIHIHESLNESIRIFERVH